MKNCTLWFPFTRKKDGFCRWAKLLQNMNMNMNMNGAWLYRPVVLFEGGVFSPGSIKAPYCQLGPGRGNLQPRQGLPYAKAKQTSSRPRWASPPAISGRCPGHCELGTHSPHSTEGRNYDNNQLTGYINRPLCYPHLVRNLKEFHKDKCLEDHVTGRTHSCRALHMKVMNAYSVTGRPPGGPQTWPSVGQ